ncbi:MAG: pantoate--beta-alanine ligase [Bacteroidota bacterium]
MEIIREVIKLREYRSSLPAEKVLGFVPTMGALHQGHASLIRQSVKDNTVTTVSIFVNPTQFAPDEDLDKYPRTHEEDHALLASLGVDCVFQPEVSDIYSSNTFLQFKIHKWGERLEGYSRPGHLEGVLQVVSILFNLVQPDRAYFGLKDYQQCMLIKKLVEELHFPIEIVPCPIVRESDGLAMSSRNAYLSSKERTQALGLYETLNSVKEFAGRQSSVAKAQQFAQEALKAYPLLRLDYFQILHALTLEEISSLTPQNTPHAFIAAYLGNTRLIDNMSLSM